MAFRVFPTDNSNSDIHSVSLPGVGLITLGEPIRGSKADIEAALEQFYPGQFEVRNDELSRQSWD